MLVAALVGCGAPDDEIVDLRPSLTMVRIGEVVPEEMPPIPEDHYLPGIQIKSEDYETDRRLPPPFAGEPTDLSRMEVLEDPVALPDHLAAPFAYTAGSGALFDQQTDEDDLKFDDVEQGAIGDCYLVAALSAALYVDADHSVRDGLIREVTDRDGYVIAYNVRFYDAWGVPQDVRIDADLVRKNGKVTYARSMDTNSAGEEFGISLFEKAYAKWHGGYPKVGDGGWAGDVLQAITGSTATYRAINRLSDSTLLTSIENALAENRAVVAGTFGEDDGVDYAGSGVYAYHAYSVLGVKRGAPGAESMITLRNPWGESEPAGNGADDGIFDMKISDFRRLYQGVTLGGSARADTRAPAAVKDLALVGVVSGRANLTFTATGDDDKKGLAAKYDVRTSDKPIDAGNFFSATRVDVGVGSPQAPGTLEKLDVAVAESGTTYIAVRIEDEAGNVSALSNVLAVQSGDAPIDGVDPTLFDFEGGEAGFVGTGLFHRSQAAAASGRYAFYMGRDADLDYNTGSRVQADLTSPVLDLRETSTVVLMWEQILDVEGGSTRDLAVLEVATASGNFADWAVVWTKESPTEDFELATADLDAYAGKQIKVRFRFDSVDARNNAGLGWIVDDVWVWAD
jgi:hypothetical protein